VRGRATRRRGGRIELAGGLDNPATRSEVRADVRDGLITAVSVDVAMTFATGSGHLRITLTYSELGEPQHIVAPS
jgi:hypothetical protein